jgi:hypothetical protein
MPASQRAVDADGVSGNLVAVSELGLDHLGLGQHWNDRTTPEEARSGSEIAQAHTHKQPWRGTTRGRIHLSLSIKRGGVPSNPPGLGQLWRRGGLLRERGATGRNIRRLFAHPLAAVDSPEHSEAENAVPRSAQQGDRGQDKEASDRLANEATRLGS